MHFLRHLKFEAKLLESLAHLAFISTYAYDGKEKRIEDFENVSKLLAVDACFATQVFSRYLALLPNLVKYEYDYDFMFKKDSTRRISDMFGDCLVNFTGDCEDASRLVADIWRATGSVKTESPFLKCMKQMQARFDLYCTLCTIQSNANMAHCTCILVPIGGKKSMFPFAIVEGTNAISPFAATGIPEDLTHDADMPMLKNYERLHGIYMKEGEDQYANFKSNMIPISNVYSHYDYGNSKRFSLLSEKPTLFKMDQTRIGEKGASGRAESAVGWYGLFHEGFKISAVDPEASPEPFLFVQPETKLYGVSAREMKNMGFETVSLSFADTEQHKKCIRKYKDLTSWHDSKKMGFEPPIFRAVRDTDSKKIVEGGQDTTLQPGTTTWELLTQNKSINSSRTDALPIITIFHEFNVGKRVPTYFELYQLRSTGINFEPRWIEYIALNLGKEKGMTVHVAVHFIPISILASLDVVESMGDIGEIQQAEHDINEDVLAVQENAGLSASQAMATYRTVMAPFGAAAQRKLYPCSDASLVAAVAARYQQVTGQKLALCPNVDVGTLIRRNNTIPSGYEKKQKVSAQPPAAVKAHPLSGCSGNLIQAIQALRIGPHMDGKDKMQDASSYVFRNQTPEDVHKSISLVEKLHKNSGEYGLFFNEDLREDHMKFIQEFANKDENKNHPITKAWKMYTQTEQTKQDHETFMNRAYHIFKESGNIINHSSNLKKSVEDFGKEEYKKARIFFEKTKKDVKTDLSKAEQYLKMIHKSLVEASGEDRIFSEALLKQSV
jgi:hypothetical protein